MRRAATLPPDYADHGGGVLEDRERLILRRDMHIALRTVCGAQDGHSVADRLR